jgi:hypothetical protein
MQVEVLKGNSKGLVKKLNEALANKLVKIGFAKPVGPQAEPEVKTKKSKKQ